MKQSVLLILILSLFFTAQALSTDLPTLEEKYDSPTAGDDIGSTRTKVSIDEVNGSTKATLRWTAGNIEQTKGLHYEFKLEAPFDKKQKTDVELLSFDGLANATVFTAGLGYRFCEGRETCKVGLNYSIGNENFSYVDTNDITASINETQSPQSLSFYYANYFSNFLLGFSYVDQVSYRASKTKNLCFQYSESVTECADLIVGPPSKHSEKLARFTLRAESPINQTLFALNVIHNIDESITKVELPFYLAYELKPDNSKTTQSKNESTLGQALDKFSSIGGGFKISWDSFSRETRVGFFVGSTVKFFD